MVPSSLQLYVTFMKAFRDVVNKCLKMTLAEDWEASITNFSTILDDMKPTFNTIESVKYHIMRVCLMYSLISIAYICLVRSTLFRLSSC